MTHDNLSPALSRVISEAVNWCSHKPFRSPALDPCSILDMPDGVTTPNLLNLGLRKSMILTVEQSHGSMKHVRNFLKKQK